MPVIVESPDDAVSHLKLELILTLPVEDDHLGAEGGGQQPGEQSPVRQEPVNGVQER